MDFEKTCLGCMKEKNMVDGICPHCGFDKDNYQSGIHQLPLNSILNGKYMIGRVLGEGGFGITYIAIDLNLNMPVAIKEYYPNGFVSRDTTVHANNNVTKFQGEKLEFFEKGLERFLGEARSIAQFYQTNGIAKVIDFFKENETAYIVMEFVDGITLKQYLKDKGGKLDVNIVISLMKPVINSLKQVHEEGLIHRDISPDNIMINKQGDLKLLDFGAARKYENSDNKSLSIMLKPGYAPEEQYRTKGNQGPYTDVYALCATMYKMITGKTPPESLERRVEDDIVWPSALGISIPENIENLLKKGMEVLSKDRIQNMKELENCLYNGQTVDVNIKPEINSQVQYSDNEKSNMNLSIPKESQVSINNIPENQVKGSLIADIKEHAINLIVIAILGIIILLFTIYTKNKELNDIIYGYKNLESGQEYCLAEDERL